MKSFITVALALGASAAAIEKRNSNSWAGSNNYYLHALSASDQASYISQLQSFGTKVVRLWVTGISQGCQKSSSVVSVPDYEDTIGKYQTGVLDALDNVLVQLHNASIKAIISPHDANLLPASGQSKGNNGIDIYGTTYKSSDAFYSSSTAQQQYDARISSILNYQSKNFGKPWKELSEVIMAFDLQNEPMISSQDKLQSNDPDNWLCNRAANMKNLTGSSGVKVATGGIGGSQYSGHEYNNLAKALSCPSIDVISVHGYMSQASQWTPYVPSLSTQASKSSKHLMIEEFGVATGSQYDSIADQAAVFTNAGVPWLYWQVIPGKSVDETCSSGDSCCKSGLATQDNQDFEVGTGSSRANWKQLFGAADAATGNQDWTGFVY